MGDRSIEIYGYQVTIVYDLCAAKEKNVKTVTRKYDTEEEACLEAEKYQIGERAELDGAEAIIHDVMITTTLIKNLSDYNEAH